MEKRYQVFISSTFTDLKQERDKVYQAVLEIDCIPAGMELFPALDEDQFNFIKRIIDDSDYYILIIGGRYGSISLDGVSYTEKEYDYAVSKGIKIIALLHGDPQSIPSGKTEMSDEGRERLEKFRKKASAGRLVKEWTSADQLPGHVTASLNRTIKTYPAVGWVRGNVADTTALLTQINELRLENEKLRRIADSSPKIRIKTVEENYIQNKNCSITCRVNGESFRIDIPLIDVFSILAPSIISRKFSYHVKSALEYNFKLKYKPEAFHNLEIDQFDFDTISIKLIASGLVEFSEYEPDNGNGEIFWKLTDKGLDLLTRLRVSEHQKHTLTP